MAVIAVSGLGTACGAGQEEPAGHLRQPALHATEVELVPADGAPNREFGSVHFDGTTAIVGATANDSLEAGYVYLFAKSGEAYPQQAMLTAGKLYLSSSFGQHVAVSGDHAVVSSYSSAFVLAKSGGAWSAQQELAPIGASYMGISAVAIDGDTLALATSDTGSVRVYRSSGAAWALDATLSADDAAPTPYFGAEVAVRGDLVLVSAPASLLAVASLDTDPPGAVYVFRRDASGWKRVQKLVASDSAKGDRFGISLAYDGKTLVVGAAGAAAGGEEVGAVYVFDQDASGFVEQAQLVAFPSGSLTNGFRVAVAGDTLVNVPYPGSSPGFAEVFTRSAPGWAPALVVQPSGDATDFGTTLGLVGNTLVVGSAGHARAFQLQGDTACTPDGKSVDLGNGQTQSCSPYLCSAGACATACTDSTMCAAGFVCDRETGQGTCVKSGGSSDDSGGCMLRVPRSPGAVAALGLLLVPLLRRARRRAGRAA